mgnify:CR=1 FL=1
MNLKRNSIIYCITAAAALAMTSCSRLPIYSQYQHIDSEGWEKTDTLHFTIPVKQQGQYDIQLGMRTDSYYPYTQVKVVVNQKTQKTLTEHTDTLTIDITDTEGNIQGKGLSIYQYSFPLHQVILNDDDSLTVNIFHCMKRSPLPGINDIGIIVKPY